MNKNFKVKTIFLCLLVLIVSALALLPKEPLKAETQNNKVYINYALLSLGYKDVKDKNSLQIEEYIGIELDVSDISVVQKQEIINNIYAELKSYKNKIDSLIFAGLLSGSIITTDVKIEGNFIFTKITYFNLPAYYMFNGRQQSGENSNQSKPYDFEEKGLLYNKYNITLGNPLRVFKQQKPSVNINSQQDSGQTSLNVFKKDFYTKIINAIKTHIANYDLIFLFDYSSSDDRLYGNYSLKYNITGINSNQLTVYQFSFTENNIPNNVNLYFVTFNQYIWYLGAIIATLLVIGVLYMVVFIKHKKDKQLNQNKLEITSESLE